MSPPKVPISVWIWTPSNKKFLGFTPVCFFFTENSCAQHIVLVSNAAIISFCNIYIFGNKNYYYLQTTAIKLGQSDNSSDRQTFRRPDSNVQLSRVFEKVGFQEERVVVGVVPRTQIPVIVGGSR